MNWLNKMWMTQNKLQIMRREIEEDQLARSTERHRELGLFRTGNEMQGRPCNLYLGCVSDEDGLFERIMPIAFDVIAENLKGYSVYTHITPTGLSHQPPCVPSEVYDTTRCYAEKIQVSDTTASNVFYDDDASCITYTQGADLPTLTAFCNAETSWHFENQIYGFMNPPANLLDNYNSIVNFFDENRHEMVFSFHRIHVGLDIQIKPHSAMEQHLIHTIISVCEKHKMPLHIYFT